jgi:hypothetical protein
VTRGVQVRIGGQTRTLLFTTRGVLAFKTWLPGGAGLRDALLLQRDPATVSIACAAALVHEDKKITPGRVMGWMDQDLRRFPEIEAKVLEAAERYFREAGIIEDDEGEAAAPAPLAAPAPSSPGMTSSASPDDTDSTPTSSET